MSLFVIDHQDRLVLNPDILSITAFRKIWEMYEDKLVAEKYLCYIYHYASDDLDNPYQGYTNEERKIRLTTEYLKQDPKTFVLPPEIDVAIADYIELSDTFELRILRNSKKAVEKMAEYLGNVDFAALNELTFEAIYDPKKVTDIVKAIGPALKSITELEEGARKSKKSGASKVRGGGAVGMFEN